MKLIICIFIVIISLLNVFSAVQRTEDVDEEDIIEKQNEIMRTNGLNNISSGICILSRWFPTIRNSICKDTRTLLSQLDLAYVENRDKTKNYKCKKIEEWLNYGKNAPSVASLKSASQRNIESYMSNIKYMENMKNFYSGVTNKRDVADTASKIVDKIAKIISRTPQAISIAEVTGQTAVGIINTLKGLVVDQIVVKILYDNAIAIQKYTETGKDQTYYYNQIAKKVGIKIDAGDGIVILNSLCEYLAAQELLAKNGDLIKSQLTIAKKAKRKIK